MVATAKLGKVRVSPRKARLVVDSIRGRRVTEAVALLTHQKKKIALPLSKLLLSAAANWLRKAGDQEARERLVIRTIFVDGAGMYKRIKPAPQGRAHRIRKRLSQITVVVGDPSYQEAQKEAPTAEGIQETSASKRIEKKEEQDTVTSPQPTA